ncbi:MAG: hypothetical protein D3910_20500 [Candidatus Electrothrix sp. ATG2]|nr:hypothetical protein [Candidatus Electrothrix sp. ATG2]
MKNIMIWFCGTGTKQKSMEFFFGDQKFNELLVVDGVGTKENNEKSQKMADRSWYNPSRWFFSVTRTQVKGYKEEHQLSSADQFMWAVIEKLEKYHDKEVHLIIGGHSRGAAGGIIGLITSLYASCKIHKSVSDHLLFKKVKKITLLPVDPVAGPKGNDRLGFTTLHEEEKKISYLLNYIEKKSGMNKLFNIVLYTARFDARNQFKLDDVWHQFQTKPEEFVTRLQYFIAGFRHSAMVDCADELTDIYGSSATPMVLLKEIISQLSGNAQVNPNKTFKTIALTEKALMDRLRVRKEPQKLYEKTKHQSYDYGKIVYSGDSLYTILSRRAKTNLTKTPENNRYLEYFPS